MDKSESKHFVQEIPSGDCSSDATQPSVAVVTDNNNDVTKALQSSSSNSSIGALKIAERSDADMETLTIRSTATQSSEQTIETDSLNSVGDISADEPTLTSALEDPDLEDIDRLNTGPPSIDNKVKVDDGECVSDVQGTSDKSLETVKTGVSHGSQDSVVKDKSLISRTEAQSSQVGSNSVDSLDKLDTAIANRSTNSVSKDSASSKKSDSATTDKSDKKVEKRKDSSSKEGKKSDSSLAGKIRNKITKTADSFREHSERSKKPSSEEKPEKVKSSKSDKSEKSAKKEKKEKSKKEDSSKEESSKSTKVKSSKSSKSDKESSKSGKASKVADKIKSEMHIGSTSKKDTAVPSASNTDTTTVEAKKPTTSSLETETKMADPEVSDNRDAETESAGNDAENSTGELDTKKEETSKETACTVSVDTKSNEGSWSEDVFKTVEQNVLSDKVDTVNDASESEKRKEDEEEIVDSAGKPCDTSSTSNIEQSNSKTQTTVDQSDSTVQPAVDAVSEIQDSMDGEPSLEPEDCANSEENTDTTRKQSSSEEASTVNTTEVVDPATAKKDGVERRAKHSTDDKRVHVHDAEGQDKENVDFSMADFGSMSKQAEQRLTARRAAREEARQIRMKELEKQQREMEEKQDRIYELTKDSAPVMVPIPLKSASSQRIMMRARSFSSSRRGSDDSASSEDTRELKKQVAELEEKYKKAMMNNAQLDNEKQKYRYEVDDLKDKYEEIEESHLEIQRLHKERCRELETKKRDFNDLQIENEYLKLQITQRDKLIQEYGLVFVSNETVEEENDKKKKNRRRRKKEEQEADQAALVTPDALSILGKVSGNLDERLKSMSDTQTRLEDEMRKLRIELDEERAKNVLADKYSSNGGKRDSALNGPSLDESAHEANYKSWVSKIEELERNRYSSNGGKRDSALNGPSLDESAHEASLEAQKQLTEHRYKLKKAEQDITALEGNVIRLESQVKRFKSSAEEADRNIEDMKQEKRKLQRDLRDAQYRVEELNSQNQNLQARIKTLKQERIDSIISGKS